MKCPIFCSARELCDCCGEPVCVMINGDCFVKFYIKHSFRQNRLKKHETYKLCFKCYANNNLVLYTIYKEGIMNFLRCEKCGKIYACENAIRNVRLCIDCAYIEHCKPDDFIDEYRGYCYECIE